MITAQECLTFLTGNGSGYGSGSGYSNSYGYNYDYDFYDYGKGIGYGYGKDDSNVNGYGYGDGQGQGNCGGQGKGDGEGYGNGIGYGYGKGDGNNNFTLPHPYYKVDGIWCEFIHIHGNYARVHIIDMYNVKNCHPAWIVKDGTKFAHGATLHEAYESLMYKISDRDTGCYANWKLDDIKTKSELISAYRVITGACEFGTRAFCNGRNLPDKCTVANAIKLTRGQYGNERFESFFKSKV